MGQITLKSMVALLLIYVFANILVYNNTCCKNVIKLKYVSFDEYIILQNINRGTKSKQQIYLNETNQSKLCHVC